MPLIHEETSLAADMHFGWKPDKEFTSKQQGLSGAPIPLHYDFEEVKTPLNPMS